LLVVAAAFAIGHVAALKAGPPLASWWRRRTDGSAEVLARSLCALIRAVIALLILIAARSLKFADPVSELIVATAIGVAAALLVYRLARIAGARGATASLLAAVALVAGTAGRLGGLEPLLAGLDAASLSVGTRRISLLGVLNAALVIAVLLVVTRLAIRLLGQSIERVSRLDSSQRVLFQKLAGVGVVVAAILIGIDLLGIDLTALAVFSGALGLAVGFGLQKTFGNLLAGLILLMDRSVKPGDVIVVADTFGWVNKIGVRAVSVITRDGKEHLIPNELLMTERVENWSFSSRDVRIRIPIGIAYDSDLTVAEKLMIEAATAATRVLARPAPNVWLRGFGERSVEYDILVWISDPEQGVGNVQSDILNRLWRLFKDNGIEIPFPQRDVHIRSMPDGWPGTNGAAAAK
jgi:small-conductance mechanosensitive channel